MRQTTARISFEKNRDFIKGVFIALPQMREGNSFANY